MIVGRGCLGRPWLFRDLAAVFNGNPPPEPPNFGEVVDTMLQHARLLIDWFGEGPALRGFRRHTAWYTKGFRGSSGLRRKLMAVVTYEDLLGTVADIDREQPFPPEAMRVKRGKGSGTQVVALPEGYLDQRDDDTPPVHVEEAGDGG